MGEEECLKTNYIAIREATILSGLCAQTLRKLADQNKIGSYRTLSGQRKFDKNDIIKMCSNVSSIYNKKDNTKINYIYARISSKKQSEEIEKQIEFIKSKIPDYTSNSYKIVSDISSGVNFKRKGLNIIIESCIQNNIGEVFITHKDILSRFGFDIIKLFIKKAGGKITIINDEQNKSSEQELVEDLLSIIHIYTCDQTKRKKL
jgi:predicted site-specific integrase-resolvase